MAKFPTGQFTKDSKIDSWSSNIVKNTVKGYEPAKPESYKFKRYPLACRR